MDKPPNPNPNPNKATLCEECRSNPWKYRCPGCSVRSCSLPCVNSHKQRTGCTGKRKLAEVVPLAEFDDNLLISDYNLLEEVKRLAESSRRLREGVGRNFRRQLPRRLRSAADRRKIRLRFMSVGMSRREKNKTRYCPKKESILWTVEWSFHSTDVVLTDHDVDEHVSLSTVIKKHLKPGPWNNQLRPFFNAQLDDLKFFLRRNQRSPNSPFRQLNIKAPIGKQLASTVILEYPVIHVFLPSHSYDFEVEKWKLHVANWEPPGSSGSIPSPQGPPLREEEIEEGEVLPYTGVLDRRDYASSARIPKDVTAAEKAGNPDVQMPRAAAEVSKPFCDKHEACVVEEGNRYSNGGANSVKFSEDAAFDFEKQVWDFYSDFAGEMNPADFLCLDNGQDGLEKRTEKSLFLGAQFLQDEELEEGEIPS